VQECSVKDDIIRDLGAHAAAAVSRCCCIALLFALLLLTPLAPAAQWPHGLLPTLFPPLLLLSKVHMLLPLYRAAAACTAAAVAYTPRPCSAMAARAVVLPSPASVPTLKVRQLPLYHAAAACTAACTAAYTPRPCSAMATHADARPSPASAPALKGVHTVAAVLRCCCCCLHPSPLQCNGRTGCCPAFSRLCPCSQRCACCRCCIALLLQLLLTPLAPAVQRPHMLLPTLFPPLPLL
jgi:hypothetical protein